ncbi:MAG: radical SAM protein, partial [Candidatus Diapherotrites archaeon]
VCVGEGEETLREVAERIEKKRSLKGLKGIVYRGPKGKILENPRRPMLENLDLLPFPAFELFDLKRYIPLPNQYMRLPLANMITSRGCSYAKCTFCFEAGIFGHKFRRQSPERVVRDIKRLVQKYGVKEISFWDDNFVVGKDWLESFAKLLEKEKLGISWSCYAKVSLVNPEILSIMKKAGCWIIFYGIEAGDQKLLDTIRKGITIKQIKQAIEWTEKAGIESRGAFMLALPGETPALAEKTIKLALSLPLDYAQFALTTPYPGSVLFRQCSEEGKINYDFTRYGSFEPVFIPKAYKSEKELKALLKSAYRRFYFRPSYVWRRLSRVRSFEDIKRNFEGLLFLVGMNS